MPTYYETLNVATSATEQEILAAFDQHYNQWRRLVSHADPTIAAQASQAIHRLETIRTTLIDPARRAAYDAGIGIGMVDGVTDPTALVQATAPAVAAMPPKLAPTSVAGTRPAVATGFVDAWICPRCQHPNAKGSRHCKQCGQGLAQDCPKCRNLFELLANFCPSCGERPEVYLRRQEQERIAAEQLERQTRKQALDAKLAEAEAHLRGGRYKLADESLLKLDDLAPEGSDGWYQVEDVRKRAGRMRTRAIWKLTPVTLVVCLVIGVLAPAWAEEARFIFRADDTLRLIALVVSLLIGAIWPYFYFHEMGGKSGMGADYTWASVTTLLALALTPIVLGIIAIFIALYIFGSVFGS